MEDFPPEDGLPFIEWYGELYENHRKFSSLKLFEIFPFFEGYKKDLLLITKMGLTHAIKRLKTTSLLLERFHIIF
ncbi:MAG: hypothetical protein NUV46_04265 [Nanoarchaeota archaeon]|nr:hypothetical protein [Nanoarchaeota archaeon]